MTDSQKEYQLITSSVLTYAARLIIDKDEKEKDQLLVPGGRLALTEQELERIQNFSDLENLGKVLKEKIAETRKQKKLANDVCHFLNIYTNIKIYSVVS
jgi:hypothetical protein